MLSIENYSFLDRQLADLLVRLCAECAYILSPTQQKNLALLTCYTSASTRQGIIAAPLPSVISSQELDALLASPVIGRANAYKPLIIEHGHIWLNRYWRYEQELAANIVQRLALKFSTDQSSLEHKLDAWFPAGANDLQRQAVERAARLPFLIISGGPVLAKQRPLPVCSVYLLNSSIFIHNALN